jgi:hypothetical protein
MRLLIILVALAALIGSPPAAECMQANQDGEIAEGNLARAFEDADARSRLSSTCQSPPA